MRIAWLCLALVALGACKPEAAPNQDPVDRTSTSSQTAARPATEDAAAKQPNPATPESTTKPMAEVVVDGPVAVSLVDAAGRHAGWEGHIVEDIPGCRVDALDSEVAEPDHYVLRWAAAVSDTYQLIVRPRTEGSLSVRVRAGACEKSVTETLQDDDTPVTWTLRITASREACSAELVKNDRH